MTSLHLEGVCKQHLAEACGMSAMTDPNLFSICHVHCSDILLCRGQHIAMSMWSAWPELLQSRVPAAQVGFTPLTPVCSVNVTIQGCHPPSWLRGISRAPVGTATPV